MPKHIERWITVSRKTLDDLASAGRLVAVTNRAKMAATEAAERRRTLPNRQSVRIQIPVSAQTRDLLIGVLSGSGDHTISRDVQRIMAQAPPDPGEIVAAREIDTPKGKRFVKAPADEVARLLGLGFKPSEVATLLDVSRQVVHERASEIGGVR